MCKDCGRVICLEHGIVLLYTTSVAVNFADNGIVRGKKYFNCPPGHGVTVKYGAAERLPGPCRRPPVSGNTMFASYTEIQRNRSRLVKLLRTSYIIRTLIRTPYANDICKRIT